MKHFSFLTIAFLSLIPETCHAEERQRQRKRGLLRSRRFLQVHPDDMAEIAEIVGEEGDNNPNKNINNVDLSSFESEVQQQQQQEELQQGVDTTISASGTTGEDLNRISANGEGAGDVSIATATTEGATATTTTEGATATTTTEGATGGEVQVGNTVDSNTSTQVGEINAGSTVPRGDGAQILEGVNFEDTATKPEVIPEPEQQQQQITPQQEVSTEQPQQTIDNTNTASGTDTAGTSTLGEEILNVVNVVDESDTVATAKIDNLTPEGQTTANTANPVNVSHEHEIVKGDNDSTFVVTTTTTITKREVIPFKDICPQDYPPKHAMVHDHRNKAIMEYEKFMGDQVRDWNSRYDDTPQVMSFMGWNYGVWNTKHHYQTESSAWKPDEPNIFVSNGMPSSGWVQPDEKHVLFPIKETLEGNYVGFSSWFINNYGHFVHDHLPTIAFLRSVVTKDTTFLLIDAKVTRSVLEAIDPEFYNTRIKWINRDEVYNIKGNLTVSLRNSYKITIGCCGAFDPMRRWIAESHPTYIPEEERTVLYYTRGGGNPDTTHGRVLEPQHEQDVMNIIKAKMTTYGMNPDTQFVIFNGRDESQNKTLPVTKQFDLFRRAKTIIGPHGSGLGGNYAWTNPYATTCAERVQLLEFIPGTDSAVVQTYPFTTYYNTIRKWLFDYHNLLYTAKSTYDITYIDVDDLRSALDYMWDGGDPALNSILDPVDQ